MSENVKLEDMNIAMTVEDVENMSIETLKDMFMKSVAVLEAALFSQAGKESQRVAKLGLLIDRLEDRIFSEDAISTMDMDQRINLYTTSSRNRINSLQFMNKLQANISSGMETISSLEDKSAAQVSKNRKLLGEDETAEKNDIMQLIRNKIAEKIKGEE